MGNSSFHHHAMLSQRPWDKTHVGTETTGWRGNILRRDWENMQELKSACKSYSAQDCLSSLQKRLLRLWACLQVRGKAKSNISSSCSDEAKWNCRFI